MQLASNDVRYGGVLEAFRDVLVADATVVKRHRLFERPFPGTRKNSSPAAAQLHLVMSVSGGGAHKVKVTGEHANYHRTLQMGPRVAGARAQRETADDRAPARPHPHGDARAVCSISRMTRSARPAARVSESMEAVLLSGCPG